MSGKLDGRSYAGTPKNFQSTHIGCRAHRAVIFAIAWHLVSIYWRYTNKIIIIIIIISVYASTSYMFNVHFTTIMQTARCYCY